LQRREAVIVLREICECIPDESVVSWMFLEPTIKHSAETKGKEYDLHMKMALDKSTRENIESVIRRRGLLLKESKGKLIVSAFEQPIEIAV
jgi:hypothetical protein